MFHIFLRRKVKLKFHRVAQLLKYEGKINTQTRGYSLAYSAMLKTRVSQ